MSQKLSWNKIYWINKLRKEKKEKLFQDEKNLNEDIKKVLATANCCIDRLIDTKDPNFENSYEATAIRWINDLYDKFESGEIKVVVNKEKSKEVVKELQRGS